MSRSLNWPACGGRSSLCTKQHNTTYARDGNSMPFMAVEFAPKAKPWRTFRKMAGGSATLSHSPFLIYLQVSLSLFPARYSRCLLHRRRGCRADESQAGLRPLPVPQGAGKPGWWRVFMNMSACSRRSWPADRDLMLETSVHLPVR